KIRMNFSPFKIIFSISIFLFCSCSENNPSIKQDSIPAQQNVVVDSAIKKETPVIAPEKISENTLACFYVLNDKNAHSPDSVRVAKWLYPFLDSLNENTIEGSDNLFNKDAGPMGARLNPMADILATAIFTNEIDTASVDFKLNDFDILKSAVRINKIPRSGITVCWVQIPRNRYSAMLHPPSEKERQEICAEKNMDVKNWTKNSCTVFKLSVSSKENGKQINLDDYLLAAYVQ
ncbi:MAG TPA: hypothetical protein VFJ43_07465, partial [Bacteroidia bacterium]|nr:hypothetical protein [Bacteroidia bacterium]